MTKAGGTSVDEASVAALVEVGRQRNLESGVES
jgi:hypothetical protein